MPAAYRHEQRSVALYEPVLELGRGGMGTVYIARAVGAAGFERLVVLKRLHAHLLDERDAVQRFLDEARMAAWVQHANVVSTHQVGSDDDGYFLVLEYVEGASLEELLDRAALRGERMPPAIVLRIALDALAGLQAAHTARDASGRSLEILHRDVTLQNVLVGRDGVARVADFGIAKSTIGNVKTDRAYVVGKLLYLPPEYLRRETFGPPLDVYSLGVTIWLTLTGQELFGGASEAQLLTHILEQGIPRLSTAMEIEPAIDELVAVACDPNPVRRFQTARAMADSIERIGRGAGMLATHGEVSDYVERLVGTDLARRRELVAQRLANGERVSITNGPELVGVSAPLPLVHERRPDPAAQDSSGPIVVGIPGERRPWRLALGVSGVLVLVAAAVLGWQAVSGASEAKQTTVATPPPLDSTSVPTASPPPEITPETAPEPVASAAASANATAAPPIRKPIPRGVSKAPASASTSTAGAKGPVRPPEGISTANPYRP